MKFPKEMMSGTPLTLDYFIEYETGLIEKTRKKFKKRGSTFLDIGSCEFLWTINLYDLFDEVHAFEPCEKVLSFYSRDLPENITTHNVACSNFNGAYDMTFFENNIGMTMRTGSNDKVENWMKEGGASATFTAEVRTIDSYEFDSVDLIKIDAEGEDDNVIEGARNTIEKHKPLIIIDTLERKNIDGYRCSWGSNLSFYEPIDK